MIRQCEQQNAKTCTPSALVVCPDSKSKIRKSKRDYILKGEVEAGDCYGSIRGAGMGEARGCRLLVRCEYNIRILVWKTL
jgi:hypothetical protein